MSDELTDAEFEARLDWLTSDYGAARQITDGRYNAPNQAALLKGLDFIETAAREARLYLEAHPEPSPWEKS